MAEPVEDDSEEH